MDNNLDRLCFGHGIEIANGDQDVENIVQNSLGVVQEDGIFALKLYLKSENEKTSRENKEAIKKLNEKIGNLLSKFELTEDFSKKELKKLGNNIDNLFLAKELIERTLVYARYHAKGVGE